MAKPRTHFICRSCGGVQTQWMGKCPDCGTWDALEKFIEPKPLKESHAAVAESWLSGAAVTGSLPGQASPTATAALASAVAEPLSAIESTDVSRLQTGIGELDRVLGGGLVRGSVVLLGGEPGIGKSTLMLQAAGRIAQGGHRVLYVTSEESAYQTRLRAQRVFENAASAEAGEGGGGGATLRASGGGRGKHWCDQLFILADTNLARIVEQARRIRPAVCVIDSIQMVYKNDVEASPGSVTQLRRVCTDLGYLAKISNMGVALVGHITKDGHLAGPKLLEHLVDVVLLFEGDRHHAHRVVRGVKNRYGTTLEVGLFEMTGHGLAEITNPAVLLDPHLQPRPGSVVCPAMHGSRCLLVEIQALTATGFLGAAKRKTSGLDGNRLAMLIAVLEKHGGLRLADQDVFASAVGGLRVPEPAADLALCMAIAGAHFGKAVPSGVAVLGEVGLGGEVRHVYQLDQRLREASRLGYRTFIMPAGNAAAGKDERFLTVGSVAQALDFLAAGPKRR
jgi:DNA repair protein RadA/Sms